jgi:ubiquinone/menaquinone biosynthesis C-methylase UbiE
MRVLDVGTGRGDVAFLAAELVGESGSVLGVDRAAEAIRAARDRAAERGDANVAFEEGDPAELAFSAPFDAVVGRYVLQFQREPAQMLCRLVDHLRPGGIVAFHEIDWTGHRSVPPVAIWSTRRA